MPGIPMYHDIDIPPDTPPEEYHWTERRAEILKLALNQGSLERLHQGQLAERYGKSQATVSKDFKRLREYIYEHQGHEFDIISELGYRTAVRKLFEQEEYYKAAKVITEMNKWAENRGIQAKEPEKHEVVQTVLEIEDPHEALKQQRAQDTGLQVENDTGDE